MLCHLREGRLPPRARMVRRSDDELRPAYFHLDFILQPDLLHVVFYFRFNKP